MWPPSKDPRDYQHEGRWVGAGRPWWLRWLAKEVPGAPYRYTLLAGAVGLALGAVLARLLDRDPAPVMIGGGLTAPLLLDLVSWWWHRGRALDGSSA